MIDDRAIDNIRRNLEQAQRDFTQAKNIIEQTRNQLADFVLANRELIEKGEVDLSSYDEILQGAEFDREWAVKNFQEAREQMIALANRLSLMDY